MAGKHSGLFQTVVIVGSHVHGILVDILEHLHRQLCHTGLGVTVGGRGVAVDGAEVAVAVHQHVALGEILGQAHQGVVHRGVTVGVVPAQHSANGVGALAVGLLRPQGVLVHGVEDAPVHRLQAVPHVGQGPLYNDRHGVVQEGLLHLLFQVNGNYLANRFFRNGGVILIHEIPTAFPQALPGRLGFQPSLGNRWKHAQRGPALY